MFPTPLSFNALACMVLHSASMWQTAEQTDGRMDNSMVANTANTGLCIATCADAL